MANVTYTPTEWSTEVAITADRLNNIEGGIEDAVTQGNAQETTINKHESLLYNAGSNLQVLTQTTSGVPEWKDAQEVQVSAEDVPYTNTSSGLTATNVQDAVDEVESNVNVLGNIITACLVSHANVNLTKSYEKIALETGTIAGNDFSISNGGILCAKAGKVMISACVYMDTLPDTDAVGAKITRNSTDTVLVTGRSTTDRCVLSIPPRLTTCSAGDVFYLMACNVSTANGRVFGGAVRTWVTLQYISQD